MSQIAFCKRGGMEGILTSTEELDAFSDFLGISYLDEFIPLPDKTPGEQAALKNTFCPEDHEKMNNVQYWEREDNGKHGWCCKTCGKVLQWG